MHINIGSDMNRLLSSLTQALEDAGIDLSHAKLSVQIDLGKRANQGLTRDESPSNKVLFFFRNASCLLA